MSLMRIKYSRIPSPVHIKHHPNGSKWSEIRGFVPYEAMVHDCLMAAEVAEIKVNLAEASNSPTKTYILNPILMPQHVLYICIYIYMYICTYSTYSTYLYPYSPYTIQKWRVNLHSRPFKFAWMGYAFQVQALIIILPMKCSENGGGTFW